MFHICELVVREPQEIDTSCDITPEFRAKFEDLYVKFHNSEERAENGTGTKGFKMHMLRGSAHHATALADLFQDVHGDDSDAMRAWMYAKAVQALQKVRRTKTAIKYAKRGLENPPKDMNGLSLVYRGELSDFLTSKGETI